MIVNHHFHYDCGGACMLIAINSSPTEELARNVAEFSVSFRGASLNVEKQYIPLVIPYFKPALPGGRTDRPGFSRPWSRSTLGSLCYTAL